MQITSGFLNSRKIKVPKTDEVRPTLSKTRSAFFDSLKSFVDFENANFLDLFSGSGIMSFEAISRGFCNVVSVEKNFKTSKIIKENYLSLNLKPQVKTIDAINFLKNNEDFFNVIYADPPFESDLYEKVLNEVLMKDIYNDSIIVLECKKVKEFDISEFKILKDKYYADVRIIFLKKKKNS